MAGRFLAVAALAFAIAAAGCISSTTRTAPEEVLETAGVQGGTGTGGGVVKNKLPIVKAFLGNVATADNSGTYVETFTGTLFDANTEKDFIGATIEVALSGSASGSWTHSVTADETASSSLEPGSFGSDGFKVWGGPTRDGNLEFKFRYTYPAGTPVGTYTFTPKVTPAGGVAIVGTPDTTTVEAFSEITFEAPVAADGAPTSSTTWGLWDAEPGATNVEAANYLKLRNSGQQALATLVLDFTPSAFASPDPDFTIPIGNNVEFAWWEDATPSVTAPSEGTFAWLPANSDGSLTMQFSAVGNVIYVKYRIKAFPELLASETYGAAFTATEL